MHTILHLHSSRMRPSVFCLLDSFDFPILYPFSALCIFSSLVSLFACLFLSDLSLSFLCAILTASSFTPVCLFHIGLSHPFCSVSVWRALELCVVCFLSLQPCLIVSYRFHSFIMPVSRFIYYYYSCFLLKCYSNGGSAQANGYPGWTNRMCPHLLGFVVSSTAPLRSWRTGSVSKISYYPDEMSNKSFVWYISIHFQFEQLFLPGVEDLH